MKGLHCFSEKVLSKKQYARRKEAKEFWRDNVGIQTKTLAKTLRRVQTFAQT